MGQPGHPDQIPYIRIWIEVLSEKPSWLQKYIKGGTGCSKVLLSAKAPKQSSSARPENKKAVLQDASLDNDFLSPPPYPPTNSQDSSQVFSLPHTRSRSSYQPQEPGPLAAAPPHLVPQPLFPHYDKLPEMGPLS
jgi:hypothetical protein